MTWALYGTLRKWLTSSWQLWQVHDNFDKFMTNCILKSWSCQKFHYIINYLSDHVTNVHDKYMISLVMNLSRLSLTCQTLLLRRQLLKWSLCALVHLCCLFTNWNSWSVIEMSNPSMFTEVLFYGMISVIYAGCIKTETI